MTIRLLRDRVGLGRAGDLVEVDPVRAGRWIASSIAAETAEVLAAQEGSPEPDGDDPGDSTDEDGDIGPEDESTDDDTTSDA